MGVHRKQLVDPIHVALYQNEHAILKNYCVKENISLQDLARQFVTKLESGEIKLNKKLRLV